MIELKNKDLEGVLIQISSFDSTGSLGGLLTEQLSLGVKRRLQKIHYSLLQKYNEFQVDIDEINKIEEEEQRNKEIITLEDEVVRIDHEFVSLLILEAIESRRNYNFELIEKIAR